MTASTCCYHELRFHVCTAPATHAAMAGLKGQWEAVLVGDPADDTTGLDARSSRQTPEFCEHHAGLVAMARNAANARTREGARMKG